MEALSKRQQEFVEKNHNLIYKAINKHNLNMEDFYGVAAIGLCKAALTFDESRGFKFSTYAMTVMDNAIKQEFRRNEKEHKMMIESLETVILVGESGEELTLGDTIQSPRFEDSSDASVDINNILKKLTVQELNVILRLLRGMKQSDIAVEIGVSRSRIHLIMQAIKKLARDSTIYRKQVARYNEEAQSLIKLINSEINYIK